MKKLKNNQYFNYLKRLESWQRFVHFGIILFLLIINIIYPWLLIVELLGLFIFSIYALYCNNVFVKQATGNGIIFGGRGKGKGLLLNKRINTDKNDKHFTNVPYNSKSEIINIKEYIDSILPNTPYHFINNEVVKVKKAEKFEGVNVYWDDVAVYAPNHMDNQLKKLYPSLPALLAINRHLYNAYMIITTQDIERPYKILRELQTDFAIKAIGSKGFSKLWNAIPFLNMISTTKYIYYENVKSAVAGKLPFKAIGAVNEGIKHGILTAGQATKEVYEAENGVIRYGRIFQLKKNIRYDTRYFHKIVYGVKAPN